MKKSIIYTALIIALTLSSVLTIAISNATTKKQNPTPSNLVATSTDFSESSTTTHLSTSKDETVYIITNPDGSPNKTFVGSTINTSNKSLPIEENITYYLDNNEISTTDLAGKSGHVKIIYHFTATESFQNKLVPFLTITTLSLNTNKFKNIKIDHGKIIQESDDNLIITGYMMPGLNYDLDTNFLPDGFTIESDVIDFELENTYTFATNEILSEIDTSKLTSVDSIVNSINDLSAGLDRIISGSSDLNDGLGSALTGIDQLQSGTTDLNNGATKLATGAQKLKSGANQLTDATTIVHNGTTELSTGITNLNNGLSSLSENSTNLNQGATTIFENLIQSINITIDNNPSIQGIITAYQIPFPLTISNYDTSLTTLINYVSIGGGDPTALTTAKASLDNYNLFYTGLLQYTGTVDYIATKTPDLASGANQLVTGTEKLNNGTNNLANGINELSDGANQLASGTTILKSGVDALASGATQLSSGSQTLYNGLTTFKSQGIDRLISFANNDLASFTTNLRSTIVAADSYHHYSNQNATSVKFIFKTPSIK